MSPFLFNTHITKAGSNLKLKDDMLDHRRSESNFSLASPTSGLGFDPSKNSRHYSPRLDGWSGGSVVSEGSISTAQSDAEKFSVFIAPRQPDASYLEGTDHISVAPSQALGREQDKFVMDLSGLEAKRERHQKPQSGSAKASRTSHNVEDVDHRRIHAADLVKDEDEYLPRVPVVSRTAIAPSPIYEGQIPLPRLYAHSPRFRACADDAVRRMRTETQARAAQNPNPNPVPSQHTCQSLKDAIDGLTRPDNAPRQLRTLDKKFMPIAEQNPHSFSFSFRKYPFPIGGPNPFRPTAQRTHNQETSFKHVISGVEHLLEDDNEEIIVYLDSHLVAKKIAVAVAEERVRPRKDRPAVLKQRVHKHFLAQRRFLPTSEIRRPFDEESFDDFPVCEMSIAMGLHGQRRPAN